VGIDLRARARCEPFAVISNRCVEYFERGIIESRCVEGRCVDPLVDNATLPAYATGEETTLECASGPTYVNTSTGQPMSATAQACPPPGTCIEGTCYLPPPDTSFTELNVDGLHLHVDCPELNRDLRGQPVMPGTTIVIRFGDSVTEGTVSKIDRSANEITVRYDDKRVEKYVLADRTAPDTRTVQYTNDTKQKVTRYFRLKS